MNRVHTQSLQKLHRPATILSGEVQFVVVDLQSMQLPTNKHVAACFWANLSVEAEAMQGLALW